MRFELDIYIDCLFMCAVPCYAGRDSAWVPGLHAGRGDAETRHGPRLPGILALLAGTGPAWNMLAHRSPRRFTFLRDPLEVLCRHMHTH